MGDKKSSVQRVIDELKKLNLSTQFKDLPQSTRTASEAAAAVNCHVSQIVKSLIFQSKSTHKPVLVLTSGSNQVDEAVVGAVFGEEIRFASAKFVREMTGFAIGGVSPFGLKGEITTYIDEDLLKHPVIWAAAGSHNTVFSIFPEDLVSAIDGQVITVH
jgi:prolyl-tRNA editing enzyme YbaK/EbsC (Cys-tRNA(Pro) deacylase)